MNALRNLRNDDLQTRGAVISTAEALRAFLQYRPEVILLRKAIDEGEVTPIDIMEYIDELTRQFSMGENFAYEVDLSAISVALETFFGPFAEEYLGGLARLQIQELLLAPRVARLCVDRRSKIITGMTVRKVVVTEPRYDEDHFFKVIEEFKIQTNNDWCETEIMAS